MFLLTRRQAHAALAGTGAALAYLAAAELGSRKTVRVGGLMVLSSMAMAGLMASKTSAKARSTEDRLNAHIAATAPAVNFVANGGSVGGNINMAGNNINDIGSLGGNGGNIGMFNGLSLGGNNIDMQSGNVNDIGALTGAGGGNISVAGIAMTGNIDMQNHNINDINAMTGSGGANISIAGAAMTGNIDMQSHNINDVGSMSGAGGGNISIAGITMSASLNMAGNNINGINNLNPSGTPTNRADLGAGATLAQVQARCDYLNDTLAGYGLVTNH